MKALKEMSNEELYKAIYIGNYPVKMVFVQILSRVNKAERMKKWRVPMKLDYFITRMLGYDDHVADVTAEYIVNKLDLN